MFRFHRSLEFNSFHFLWDGEPRSRWLPEQTLRPSWSKAAFKAGMVDGGSDLALAALVVERLPPLGVPLSSANSENGQHRHRHDQDETMQNVTGEEQRKLVDELEARLQSWRELGFLSSFDSDIAAFPPASDQLGEYVSLCSWLLFRIHQAGVADSSGTAPVPKLYDKRVASSLIEIALGIALASSEEEASERLFGLMARGLALPLLSKKSWISHIIGTRYLPVLLERFCERLSRFPILNEESESNETLPLLDSAANSSLTFLFGNIGLGPTSHALIWAIVERVDPPTLMRAFLTVLASRQSDTERRWNGHFLSNMILKEGGVRYFITEFVRINSIYGLELSQLEQMANLLSAVPSQSKGVEDYYSKIGPQIASIFHDVNSSDTLIRCASHVVAALVARNPKAGRTQILIHLIGGLQSFFTCRRMTPLPPGSPQCDHNGNPIISSEEEIAITVQSLRLLLVGTVPTPALIESIQNTCFPLFSILELYSTAASSEEVPVQELLKSILRQLDDSNTTKVLLKIATSTSEGETPVAILGPSGRAVFVKKVINWSALVGNPDVFVNLLAFIGNSDWNADVFIQLFERYLSQPKESANGQRFNASLNVDKLIIRTRVLHISRLLLSMIAKFGPDLMKKQTQSLALAQRVILDAKADDTGLLLALSIVRSVYSARESLKATTPQTRDLLIILQTLESHRERSVSELAKDVRKFVGSVVSGASFTAVTPSESDLQTAFEEIADEMVPVRAHGMSLLRDLITKRDPVAVKQLQPIISIFLDLIQDEDSYLYLNAIKGMATLTDQYPTESMNAITSRYEDAAFTVDYRQRLGEVLHQTVERLDEAFSKYVGVLLPPIMKNLGDESPGLRKSAISLLAIVVEKSPESVQPQIRKLVAFLDSFVQSEADVECRRGGVLAIRALVRGFASTFDRLPDGVAGPLVRRLRAVIQQDSDEAVRGHAGQALAEIETFPGRS
ncbi:hypothetical protein DFJ73DRAFT_241022 [Zopfochytrium polystomum]|nr:hypothetical protein DFJ73DRAFT_241022 [Zopfochytrium polystomum]